MTNENTVSDALALLADAYDAVDLNACAAIDGDAHDLCLTAEILLRGSRDFGDFMPSGPVRRHFLALCSALTRQIAKLPRYDA